ncbi:hypothetical protein ASG52_11305 [Methylobacterium sp. Leaf456]|uniref:hypothetical protein n=1 Tax=Methylobacterium sp. Leaf456 TaxID=1736382 RepID=UPI0006FA8F65|nr:hypothetical protein [Methylobacterium sp. Leaf456]KQT47937.1 hypothetical protein ASG52_11305 [Methylobacterium sp. Leaf456]
MRPISAVLLLAGLIGAGAAQAQGTADTRLTPSGRSVTATGQTKPPPPAVVGAATGQPGQLSAASQEQMLKAQRAARDRDKAWDAKMNRTMGSICKGC